jgi:N-acyl-D-aspartate/D-glutamate deacylase
MSRSNELAKLKQVFSVEAEKGNAQFGIFSSKLVAAELAKTCTVPVRVKRTLVTQEFYAALILSGK